MKAWLRQWASMMAAPMALSLGAVRDAWTMLDPWMDVHLDQLKLTGFARRSWVNLMEVEMGKVTAANLAWMS